MKRLRNCHYLFNPVPAVVVTSIRADRVMPQDGRQAGLSIVEGITTTLALVTPALFGVLNI